MALTDTDHLPFSTITGATTFNDWRRITNGLGKDIEGGIQTGSHLYLSDYDWSGRVSRASVLPSGATTGTESPVGTVWDPATSVSYDSTEGGVRFTLGSFPDQTQGSVTGKMRMWARIQTRMPIDEFANYRVKVRIKNLRTTGDNRIYLGFTGLNSQFQALRTDSANTFNYGLASFAALPNNDVTEYSAIISGFNTSGDTTTTKFDPGTKFADIVFINHYVTTSGGDPWVTTQDDVIIQNIEIERMPSGIIITEHDNQDDNPRTALQIGYSTEQTYSGTSTGTGIGLDVNSSAQIRGSLIFHHADAANGGNTDIDHIYHADGSAVNYGNSFHFESDNSLRSQEGAYTRGGHGSTLRAGRIVGDYTNETYGHSALANTMYLSKDVNYSGDSGEHAVSPMLVLAVAGNDAASTGAGPSIDFHIPDSTGNDLTNKIDVELPSCALAGRIACEKSQAGEAYGSGDLVFSARRNAGTMQELLRLHPALGSGVTKQGVTVGDESSSTKTDLDVTGSISTINGVNYTWPTSDAGGTVDGTKKILTYSGGSLSWQTLSNATTNQTVFVQNQTLPIGSVIPWAGDPTKIPVGEFVECTGQEVRLEVAAGRILSTEVAALYAAIGTQYGTTSGAAWTANGNSYPRFKLPDLRKKVAVGRQGSTVFDTGDTGGSQKIYVAARTQCGHTDSKSITSNNTTLTTAQIPSHQHYIATTGSTGTAILGTNNQLEHYFNYQEAGSDQPNNPNFEYALHGATNAANVGRTSGIIGTNGGSHNHGITIPALDVDLDAIDGATNSNYPPYIALTYIMKVKADKIGTLGVTLGDSSFNAFTTTGGTTGELSFDTTGLQLKAGHPTWTTTRLNSYGYDFYLNTGPGGGKANAARAHGLALVALSDKLDINYQGQIGDYTKIGTSGNTKIEVIGPNSSSSADNQIYHTATYHLFNHTSNLASPVSGAPATRALTINSANGTATLDNSTITKINSVGVKAVVTKEYVDNTYQPGEVVQQFYHRVDDVLVYGIDGTTGKLSASTYTTPGQTGTGQRVIDLQGLNFISGSGGTARSLYAMNLPVFEISITPKFSDSLIVVEFDICGEAGTHNTGMWMGEVNSSGAAQVITRSGYEGYNPNAPVGYNNFYFAKMYDGDGNSTIMNHRFSYIDKPNTTSQKTYVPIYASIHGALSNRELHVNRTVTLSAEYNYEYGVSNMSIKEIRQ